MPRDIQTSYRISSEASFSDEVDLIFLTITHSLITPIYVVNDTVDYNYDSHAFIGFPFEIGILSDDESPPTARLSLQNVDPRIGDSIRSLMTSPQLKIELLSSADFDITVDPRTEIGTPTVVYSADKLFLTNISVDILTISGTIVGWDYQQRVWPGPRAMQAVFPGLFR